MAHEDTIFTSTQSWAREHSIPLNILASSIPQSIDVHSISGDELHTLINGRIRTMAVLKTLERKFSGLMQNLLLGRQQLMGGVAGQILGNLIQHIKTMESSLFLEASKDLASHLSLSQRFYVPILRGMRPLNAKEDLFHARTMKDYFSQTGSPGNIITGFGLYDLLARSLLGQPEEREKVRQYEAIIGEEFFGGENVTLIPEYGKDTVSVKIGNDKQFPIYDLGDGLQQVIIITSSTFLDQQKSIYFIEEPEICLHSGLLRKLVLSHSQ
jgi:hypothetical protein